MNRRWATPLIALVSFTIGGVSMTLFIRHLQESRFEQETGMGTAEQAHLVNIDRSAINKADLNFLLAEIRSKSPSVRSMAYQDLAQSRGPLAGQAHEAVRKILTDPDPTTRMFAAPDFEQANLPGWKNVVAQQEQSGNVEAMKQARIAMLMYKRDHDNAKR